MRASDGFASAGRMAVKSGPRNGVLRMEYIAGIIIALAIWLGIRELRLMLREALHFMYALRKKR